MERLQESIAPEGKMKISTYLKLIRQKVVSCKVEDSAQTVAKLLTDANIGAMPVLSDDGKIVGMISERDLTNRFAKLGADVTKLKVADMLTKSVTFMGPNATLADAFNNMRGRSFRHIPVLESGKVIGILSIRDVLEEFAVEVGVADDLSDPA